MSQTAHELRHKADELDRADCFDNMAVSMTFTHAAAELRKAADALESAEAERDTLRQQIAALLPQPLPLPDGFAPERSGKALAMIYDETAVVTREQREMLEFAVLKQRLAALIAKWENPETDDERLRESHNYAEELAALLNRNSPNP